MRRRLLNQTHGDPAAEAIAANESLRLGDIARLHFQQPEIVSRRDRERVTEEIKNDSAGSEFQGPDLSMSSQPGRLPPAPVAPKRPVGRPRKYPL